VQTRLAEGFGGIGDYFVHLLLQTTGDRGNPATAAQPDRENMPTGRMYERGTQPLSRTYRLA
jgi:hypothetical protein